MVENLKIAEELGHLYQYLIDRNYIEQLHNFNEACQNVFSRDVLARIANGDPSWEGMVPPEVADVIKKRCFFGYCET